MENPPTPSPSVESSAPRGGRAAGPSSWEPMCACRPRSDSPSTACSRAIASPRVRHREAELRVGLAGGDLLVGLALDVRRHAHEHRLTPAAIGERALGHEPLQAVDLVEVVEDDQPHAMAQRHAQLRLGLGVAVQHDPLGGEAGRERQVQLAPGGHVAPQPLAARTAPARRCRGTPWRRTPRGSRRGRRRGRPARRPARARPDRPRRPRRRGCRTPSPARSCRSRRPPGGRARSDGCPAGRRERGSSR